jgi:hypothetical protein
MFIFLKEKNYKKDSRYDFGFLILLFIYLNYYICIKLI